MYEPMINCGVLSGNKPECWHGVPFNTREECEHWINENMDNFSMLEIAGGIFPLKIN